MNSVKEDRIIAILFIHGRNEKIDVDIPLDITANDLIVGLNLGYELGMDTSDLSKCFLRSENPIALLKGNRTLREYGLRNGTTLHYI